MANVPLEEFLGTQKNVVSMDDFLGGGNFKVVKPESEPEKLNFAQRFGENLKKRADMAKEISQATLSGEQSWAEGILQVAGKVGVGGVLDFIGEAVISAGRGLGAITPDAIEEPIKEKAKAAGLFFLNTPVGQLGLEALQGGIEQWEEFREESPRAARNIEALVDIGILFAPVKKKPKAAPTKIGALGEKAIVSGKKKAAQIQAQFIDDLVRPQQTKRVRIAQTARTTEEGLLRTKVIAPSASERAIAREVSKVSGISSRKTLQGNLNSIHTKVASLGDDLEKSLVKNDVFFPRKEVSAALKVSKQRLAQNPTIVGDAEKTAQKMIEQFQRMFNKNKSSASGLLKTRKQFDNWIKSQKGAKAFNPNTDNALSVALKEVRNTTNNFIERKATNVAVKESLRRQTMLYRALDNIAPKAADEASSVVLRAWQNVSRVLNVKSSLVQTLALLAGLGGLGAAAVFAPFVRNFILGGFLLYGAKKVIMSSSTRKFLGQLLKTVDVAIRRTKDANLIRELRADRVLILEILKSAKED